MIPFRLVGISNGEIGYCLGECVVIPFLPAIKAICPAASAGFPPDLHPRFP
jgi:hypothetical protein